MARPKNPYQSQFNVQHPTITHRVSVSDGVYGPPEPTGTQAAKVATDELLDSWRTLATAIGQSAPHNLNRAQTAISGLRRYGG